MFISIIDFHCKSINTAGKHSFRAITSGFIHSYSCHVSWMTGIVRISYCNYHTSQRKHIDVLRNAGASILGRTGFLTKRTYFHNVMKLWTILLPVTGAGVQNSLKNPQSGVSGGI